MYQTQKNQTTNVRIATQNAPKLQPLAPALDIPHWLPHDANWSELPQDVRETGLRIVTPAYRQLVLEAPNETERAIGLALVRLIWLELSDQMQMAAAVADPKSQDTRLNSHADIIERHLRLAAAKCRTTELLFKIRILQYQIDSAASSPPPIGA